MGGGGLEREMQGWWRGRCRGGGEGDATGGGGGGVGLGCTCKGYVSQVI